MLVDSRVRFRLPDRALVPSRQMRHSSCLRELGAGRQVRSGQARMLPQPATATDLPFLRGGGPGGSLKPGILTRRLSSSSSASSRISLMSKQTSTPLQEPLSSPALTLLAASLRRAPIMYSSRLIPSRNCPPSAGSVCTPKRFVRQRVIVILKLGGLRRFPRSAATFLPACLPPSELRPGPCGQSLRLNIINPQRAQRCHGHSQRSCSKSGCWSTHYCSRPIYPQIRISRSLIDRLQSRLGDSPPSRTSRACPASTLSCSSDELSWISLSCATTNDRLGTLTISTTNGSSPLSETTRSEKAGSFNSYLFSSQTYLKVAEELKRDVCGCSQRTRVIARPADSLARTCCLMRSMRSKRETRAGLAARDWLAALWVSGRGPGSVRRRASERRVRERGLPI